MNTLEINTLLKKHPHSRPVFKGIYARNRLPRLLNVPSALVGNTDPDHPMGQHWVAIYINANSRGEYYDPTARPPFLRAYVNFMKKHCHTWTRKKKKKKKTQWERGSTTQHIPKHPQKRRETPTSGVTSLPVALSVMRNGTTTIVSSTECTRCACAHDHIRDFRTVPLQATCLTSLLVEKVPPGGYCATSGCACAYHTSGSGHGQETSGDVTSGCAYTRDHFR